MDFQFATAGQIIFGAGAIKSLGSIAVKHGRKALLVTGSRPTRAEELANANMNPAGIDCSIFCVKGEPDLETIRRGVEMTRAERCDFVIGFGGGSALDSAKAIAAMMTNPGDVLDYLEVIGGGKSLLQPSAPMLAIPTTAGTGSEVTRNAVIASSEHRVKASLRSQYLLPRLALVDPELTHAVPPNVTARTGMDALTQVIEPFVCRRANPLTDGWCMEGIKRAGRSLRTAFNDGANSTAREDMALASLFGGLALANAGLGAVHGFAGVIGGSLCIPHGTICAALLPHVMRANLRALREREPNNPALRRYDNVAEVLTGHPTATAADGVKWIEKLVGDLKIPTLGILGMKTSDISEVVEKSQRASSMKANPISLSGDELAAILESAL